MQVEPKTLLALAAGLGALTGAGSAAAQEQGHRHHEAHVHGVARLNVALDGPLLYLELHTPAANLVGFEHAPRAAAEREAVAAAAAALRDGAALFELPAPAGCTPTVAGVHSVLLEHRDEPHAQEADSAHADFEARWTFRCTDPAALGGLTVRLFEAFPGIENLDVQALLPAGQRAARLAPGRTRLDLAP